MRALVERDQINCVTTVTVTIPDSVLREIRLDGLDRMVLRQEPESVRDITQDLDIIAHRWEQSLAKKVEEDG